MTYGDGPTFDGMGQIVNFEPCPNCGCDLEESYQGKLLAKAYDKVVEQNKRIASLEAENTKLREENLACRKALWLLHPDPIGMKYGDDGEMQLQGIDFKRGEIYSLIEKTTKAIQVDYAALREENERLRKTYRDSQELILADEQSVRNMQKEIERLRSLMREIAEHPHRTGDKLNEQDSGCAGYCASTSGLTGRREGHRCCAAIASKALEEK